LFLDSLTRIVGETSEEGSRIWRTFV